MNPSDVQVYVPTRGSIWHETVTRVWATTAMTGLAPPIPMLSKVGIVECRHEIARKFMAGSAQVLVMIDDDVVPPGNWLGIVDRIIDRDVDVCAAVVPISRPGRVIMPNVFRWFAEQGADSYYDLDGRYIGPEDEIPRWPGGVGKADAVGFGCVAIHRKVLQRLSKPFEPTILPDGTWRYGEDITFCKKAKGAGFKIGVDDSIWCEHVTPLHLNGVAESYIHAMSMAFDDDEEDQGDAAS